MIDPTITVNASANHLSLITACAPFSLELSDERRVNFATDRWTGSMYISHVGEV